MPGRIGFVDFDLNNFHANVFLRHLREDLKDRGFTVEGCYAIKEAEGRDWATKNGVPFFADAGELDRRVDAYAVLAPADPHTHLSLCERVFPFAKPTYVDKTFAPDLATAERIFALADKYRVPMQTASALRYTSVQKAVADAGRDTLRHMIAWGSGRSFGEYAIHPVELVVSCMGPDATRLMRRGDEPFSQLLIDFAGDRTAIANVYTAKHGTPFGASITTDQKTTYHEPDMSRLFIDAAAAMLDLFETRQPGVDRRESLTIRRILDAAERPEARERFVNL
jgi:hypothetical protein